MNQGIAEIPFDGGQTEWQPGMVFMSTMPPSYGFWRLEKFADGRLIAKRLTENLRQRHLLWQVEPLNPNVNSVLLNF